MIPYFCGFGNRFSKKSLKNVALVPPRETGVSLFPPWWERFLQDEFLGVGSNHHGAVEMQGVVILLKLVEKKRLGDTLHGTFFLGILHGERKYLFGRCFGYEAHGGQHRG